MTEYYIAMKENHDLTLMGPEESYAEAKDKLDRIKSNEHASSNCKCFLVKVCYEENQYGAPSAYPWGDSDSNIDEDN